MKTTALKYFNAFATKDIALLRSLYSADVVLTDWDIKAVGLDEVLTANQAVFSAIDSLDVVPVKIYCDGNTVVSELEIGINGTSKIKVVDVIDFNQAGEICSIRAYKGVMLNAKKHN